MGLNVGYLTSDRSEKGDECYTPYYAVTPILKYLPKNKKIWCPFDEEWSAFYQTLKRKGYTVIRSALSEGKDFFTYEPDDYDIIVSNPPFSKKDQVIERLYELGKPFMILLPLNTLQGKRRYKSFRKGIQILAFDKGINYHTNSMEHYTKGNHFASAYYCRDVLPRDLILEELIEYDEPLSTESANDEYLYL